MYFIINFLWQTRHVCHIFKKCCLSKIQEPEEINTLVCCINTLLGTFKVNQVEIIIWELCYNLYFNRQNLYIILFVKFVVINLQYLTIYG